MITINDELDITMPEDFHEISAEEKAGLELVPGGESICLKAPDLHMIISIGWKKKEGAAGFFGKLLNGDDLVKNMDSSYKRSMKPLGYRRTEDLNCSVGGIGADGFRYEYQAQGIDMTGESMVLNKDNELYYFHVYYRTELSADSRDIWNGVLDSAKWAK